MALERANPLPPNQRYWVDVAPEDQPAFDAWLSLNAAAVHVVASKLDAGSGWQWVLFDVTAPLVFWAGPGYPTIADPGVTTEEQVKQVPRPDTGWALLGNVQTVATAAVLVAGAGVLFGLMRRSR
jgi:hypothetical protein